MPDQSSSTACPEQPPLRIGVWCKAGGKTLGPDNACGVYLFNLLAGLLRLEDPVEVVLFVGPDYQGEYATVARQGAGRVRIWPYLPPAVAPPQPPLAATASLPSSVRPGLRQRGTEILHHARRSLGTLARELFSRVRRLPRPLLVLAGLFALVASPLIWGFYAGYRITASALTCLLYPVFLGLRAGRSLLLVRRSAGVQGAGKPGPAVPAAEPPSISLQLAALLLQPDEAFVRGLYRCLLHREPEAWGLENWLQQLRAGRARLELIRCFATSEEATALHSDRKDVEEATALHSDWKDVIHAAGCQVGIIPLGEVPSALVFPAAVFFLSANPDRTNQEVPSVAEGIRLRIAEASLGVCSSEALAEEAGALLGLSRDKVQVIPPAPPADFPEISDQLASRLMPACLRRPYLFCPTPSATVGDEQECLIEALRVLRDEQECHDFDLVFTAQPDPQTAIQELAERAGLGPHVHLLGRLDRATLGVLYQNAFATLIPEPDREDSFVLSEAISWDCPVLCASPTRLGDQCPALTKAMLCFDPKDAHSLAAAVLQMRRTREQVCEQQGEASRPLWRRTWDHVAEEWLPLCRDISRIGSQCSAWRLSLDRPLVESWPRADTIPAQPRSAREVFLFLQQFYAGGVWQQTLELVSELLAVNRQRGQLNFSLGLHVDQVNTSMFERLGEELPLCWMQVSPIRRSEVQKMFRGTPRWLAARPEEEFCFFSGAAQTALRADAWFGLIDRFPLPLLPARPFGFLVWDLLQKCVPEIFPKEFHHKMVCGMIPTARNADLVIATTPQTRDDAISEFGIDPARVRLVPIACNPAWRFDGLEPRRVKRAREPFILNVTNCSKHKGPTVILEAHARLKRLRGRKTPQLVMCGWGTNFFSTAYRGPSEPILEEVRQFVEDLELQEGPDVVFLGTIHDAELLDLYQRCSIVVNAALYDNGCLCLAEGSYFGKPAVSSRYPAAEFHAERFGYPARFFPVGDAAALAEAMQDALGDAPASDEEVERARARFADPEFNYRRYAERFYDELVALAERGARERHRTPDARTA